MSNSLFDEIALATRPMTAEERRKIFGSALVKAEDDDLFPTHWRPLPAPPITGETGEV